MQEVVTWEVMEMNAIKKNVFLAIQLN